MSNGDGMKKILVVDDDNIQLTIIEGILNPHYNVICAKSGAKALEHIVQGLHPALILLDILMPEMDGFEVYRKLRAISLLNDIPIIFVSAVTETQEIQRALKIGAADYITKPYDPEDLLQRIENTLRK